MLEVASESTWKRDRDEKPAVYASMGVAEYFLYDPEGGRLDPRLQGYALRGGAYRALPSEVLADGTRGVRSAVLGLCAYLRGPGQELRWRDPATGRDLEAPEEVETAREAEAAARAAAEGRAVRETAAREAEAAARAAAEGRAAREAAAREAAETENAALRAEIRRLHGRPDA